MGFPIIVSFIRFRKFSDILILEMNSPRPERLTHLPNSHDKNLDFQWPQLLSAIMIRGAWQLQALLTQHVPGPALWALNHLL